MTVRVIPPLPSEALLTAAEFLTLREGDDLDGEGVLPGLRHPLADLWGAPGRH